jgi:endoglucanase
MYELLKELCDLVGPSGFEQDVQRYIAARVQHIADDIKVDALGNVIVTKKGNDPGYPSLLLAAHTDEIGFIVKKIEDNGLLRFEKLGGFDDRILLSQPVKVKSDHGYLNGVIGTLSAHYVKWDDPKRVQGHRDMYIDIGARSAAEVTAMGVRVGQPISYGTELKKLGNSHVSGKGLDDRAGCALLIRLFEDLREYEGPHGDITAAFTVQEEVGLRGASVLSAGIFPDFALAVDTTPTSDTKDPIMTGTRVLGEGPCIKIADKSLIAHPLVVHHLETAAKRCRIPYQLEVFMGIGTDAGAVHMTHKGVSSGVLSIPSRYTHSPHEIISLDDLEYSYELLKAFTLTINELKGKTFLDT